MPFGFNEDKSMYDLTEIQAEIDNITGIGTELRETDDLNELITPNTRYHWRGGDEYPANTPSNMDMEEGEAYRLEVMESAAEGYIEQHITCGPRTLMRYYNTLTQQWFNWRRNLTDADTPLVMVVDTILSNITVDAGSGYSVQKTVTSVRGYTPIGIVGVNTYHNMAGHIGGFLLVGNTAFYRGMNTSTVRWTDQTITWKVLYMRTA